MRKLLFFHADWCPPCRFVEREFISPLERLVGKEKIIHVDAQSDPFIAEKYHVDKLPTCVILDGKTLIALFHGMIELEGAKKILEGGERSGDD